MNIKITISFIAVASLLLAKSIANAQTCGTSQVTYSGYTSGYLPKWNATTGCINNSSIFDNGEVGVGLTAPASRFHSAGQIRSGIPSGGLGGASATTGSLLFYNSSNTNTVNIQSGVTTTSYTMTLPATQGAASSVLTNNGSGGLDWAQLTVGSWLLAGNTLSGTLPASPAEFIGTLNAADWIIRTNNTEKMRVQSGGNVGIGTTTPASKLDIEGGISVGATYSGASAATTNGAIIEGSVGIGTAGPSVFASTDKLVISSATAGDTHIRLQSTTYTAGSSSLFYNAGSGEFRLTQNDGGIGMSFYTGGTSTEKMRISPAGNVGIGTTTLGQLFTVGNSGDGTVAKANAWNTFSDANFKTNVVTINNALEEVLRLRGVTFNWIASGKPSIGFIAQEVETVLPYIVTTDDSTGFKSLDYSKIVPLLVESIKQLDSTNATLAVKDSIKDAKIQALEATDSITKAKLQNQDSVIAGLKNQLITNDSSLQNQLNQLMTTITNCCNRSQSLMDNGNNGNTKSISVGSLSQGETTQMDIKLNDVQSVILEQNVPNPFAEQTTINYTLPDNTAKAQMLFYNSQGKLIQSVDLVQTGKGQLNVFASDLSNGVYTYTLVVDGRIIDSKKMIRNK